MLFSVLSKEVSHLTCGLFVNAFRILDIETLLAYQLSHQECRLDAVVVVFYVGACSIIGVDLVIGLDSTARDLLGAL